MNETGIHDFMDAWQEIRSESFQKNVLTSSPSVVECTRETYGRQPEKMMNETTKRSGNHYFLPDGTKFSEHEDGAKTITKTDGQNVRFYRAELSVTIVDTTEVYTICGLVLSAGSAMRLAKRWALPILFR